MDFYFKILDLYYGCLIVLFKSVFLLSNHSFKIEVMVKKYFKMGWIIILIPLFILLSVIPLKSFSQIEIVLRKTFIDSLKNKVMYDAKFKIIHAHEKPNSPSKDGDLHIAGTANSINLPIVAEIMNAMYEEDALNIVHANEGTSNLITIKGAWRIWCEHPGVESVQDQGVPFPPIINAKPDHVFEIHPVTQVEHLNIIESLRPINGYMYKKAYDAFFKFSVAGCKIIDKGEKVLIKTNGVGYNYVEFWIEILGYSQQEVVDGRFVFCKVLNKEGEIILQKMRMAFPKDSEAEKKVKTLQQGEIMHVIGIPRIDLSQVSYRIAKASDNPEMLNWNLPVEMIIVAKFNN
jgi:hypothetical protein